MNDANPLHLRHLKVRFFLRDILSNFVFVLSSRNTSRNSSKLSVLSLPRAVFELKHRILLCNVVLVGMSFRISRSSLVWKAMLCHGNVIVRMYWLHYSNERKDENWIVLECRTQPGQPSCPLDPYFVMPDKCQCIDFQILKLQEAPEYVPHGEMPKHIQMYCDR